MNFRPDIYVSSFKKITPELLSSLGVRALLTDLDDTLVPHGCMVIPDEVKNWVAALSENGISVVPILQSICRWAGAYHKESVDNTLAQCRKCDYNTGA